MLHNFHRIRFVIFEFQHEKLWKISTDFYIGAFIVFSLACRSSVYRIGCTAPRVYGCTGELWVWLQVSQVGHCRFVGSVNDDDGRSQFVQSSKTCFIIRWVFGLLSTTVPILEQQTFYCWTTEKERGWGRALL